jgi:hypothetical protein
MVVRRRMGDEPSTGGLRRKLCWASRGERDERLHFTADGRVVVVVATVIGW